MFFAHFLVYLLLFLDGNVDEESELFSRKLNLRVLLSFCLVFCQFHLGVAYKKNV